jgi:polysaccharide biosynthesis protein PslH
MRKAGKKLKILWVSHLIPYPPKGGVLMRSNYLATELAKNHDVDLLALNQAKLLEAYYASGQEGIAAARDALSQVFGRLDFFEFSNSRSVAKKRMLAIKCVFSPLPYSVAWFESNELAEAITRCLNTNHYDVVHFDTVGLAPYRDLVGDKVPTVLDHHNVESHMMLRRAEKERNRLKKIYFFQEGYRLKQYEKKVLPLFTGHITCSTVDSNRLLAMENQLKVKTIPNSIRLDENFIPDNGMSRRSKLLFIGGLDWYPNRDAILHFCRDVWPIITSTGLDVEMNIVGKNPCDTLLNYAKKDSRIKVHGFVDDIKSFYRSSDVFVCPIRDGGGTKLKVLDAMGHFLPVVGYPEACEGIDVVEGHDALVVKTPEEFASSVVALLVDKVWAGRMGHNAHQLIKRKYEAREVGEALSQYYVEIARSP